MSADRHSLPRVSRLRGKEAFDRVFAHRKSVSDGGLVLHGCPRPMVGRSGKAEPYDGPRLGLSVSRRVGNAVIRNRWKRRIREAFRHVRGELPGRNDFVVVVRPGDVPPLPDVARALVELARRLVRRRGYDAEAGRGAS